MKLDFSILSTDKSLIFIDETVYTDKPSKPTVCVKFPSLSTLYSAVITPCEVSVLNTEKLCYSENMIDFPDGLYTITYSFEPEEYNTITKKIMKLDRAKNSIKSLLSKELSEELISKLYKIDIFIQSSEYLANIDSERSVQYFDFIQKEIKKLNC
jgi:hypothetical protein